MQTPAQVTFRGMDMSDAVEAACWEEADKLERYYDRITSCNVVITQAHRHHQKGNLFDIRIHLTIPDGDVVVNRTPPAHLEDTDAYVALREAFDTARRQLEDRVNKMRGKVKEHVIPPHGRIRELFSDKDFGIIETPEGREIYFNRNALLNAHFDQLDIGTEVKFTEHKGDKGPQASSVSVTGHLHIKDHESA